MNKVIFKLNRTGVRELLRSPEMEKVLDQQATNIKKRAGNGYSKDNYVGRNRANAMVYADSVEAKIDNKKNNTLLKSLR